MLALYPNKSQTKTLNNRIYATVKHKNRILEIKHHNDRWPGGGVMGGMQKYVRVWKLLTRCHPILLPSGTLAYCFDRKAALHGAS